MEPATSNSPLVCKALPPVGWLCLRGTNDKGGDAEALSVDASSKSDVVTLLKSPEP